MQARLIRWQQASWRLRFGEATKTVQYVMDGDKAYRFTVRWGIATNTDDAEGEPTETSDARPTREQIEAAIPQFLGTIQQIPPGLFRHQDRRPALLCPRPQRRDAGTFRAPDSHG